MIQTSKTLAPILYIYLDVPFSKSSCHDGTPAIFQKELCFQRQLQEKEMQENIIAANKARYQTGLSPTPEAPWALFDKALHFYRRLKG